MSAGYVAVAARLDFQDREPPAPKPRALRLAVPSAVFRGADKYKVLEHRRRQAQIKARRALDLLG
jgi:hypothetical protein